MNRLSRIAIESPLRTLAAAMFVVLLAVPGLGRLELRTDGQALVPGDDPAVVYDREVRERFGFRDPMVVVIRTDHPDGLFNPGTLRRVRDLTAALEKIEGIGPGDLTSLATERGFNFVPGTLRRSTFLDPLPETPAALAGLRTDLRRIGRYDGTLTSRDGRSAAILVGVPPGADRRELYRTIRGMASRESSGRDRVEVLGAPVAETLLGTHILADLGVPRAWLGDESGGERPKLGLVPLAFTVMGLVFLIGFRRPAAAVLPLVKVGACLAVVLGTMGWLGVPVYLTTAVLPIILTASGIADEAHLFRRFGELRRARPELGSAALARATLDEMARPVLLTSVTTLFGFLSFAISPMAPVRTFGLFAAAGIFLCLLWSLAVTPVLLSLLPPGWVVRRSPDRKAARRGGGYRGLAGVVVRHRWAVLGAGALISLAALDGIRRVEVQDSWVDGFAPDSAFARSMRRFDEQFRGSHILLVAVETEPRRLAGEVAGEAVGDRRLALPVPGGPAALPASLQGSWIRLELPGEAGAARQWSSWVETASLEGRRLILSWPLRGGSPKFWLQPRAGDRLGFEVELEPLMVPETLRRIGELERYLERRPGVGGVLGPAGFLETASFMVQPDRPGSRELPARPDEARVLWRNSERALGAERLRRLVDAGYVRGLITVFLKGSNYADTRRLMAEIRAWERSHQATGMSVGFAGDVTVSQTLIRAVVSTQVGSLLLALLSIFALTSLLGRSLRWGLYCVVPSTLAVLLNFAAMGWLDIPLGVATSMFAGMTLGIGVDYAIHLLSRFDRARAEGLAGEAALSTALASSGPAILIDTLAVGLGFATLLLSQVPANVRLGGLLALSLFVCFAATVALVPALLARRSEGTRPIHNGACPAPATSSGPG